MGREGQTTMSETTIERFRTTRDGVPGIVTMERSKGQRPEDRHGWDLYEGPAKYEWTLQRFEKGATR